MALESKTFKHCVVGGLDAGACGDGALRNGGRLRLLLTGQGARFSGPGNASYGQGKRGSEKWQP